MTNYILEAQSRTEKGRKTNALRANGLVPAVVYGSGIEPKNVTIDRNQMVKTYQAAGESSIVELKVDGADSLFVLIQDYQVDPLRNEYTHVDFRSIDMNKEIETEVEVEVTGESPAVKALGGTLVISCETIAVRCLPSQLIRSIKIDIGRLATLEDVIRVSDLDIPEGVKVLEDAELAVASVAPPRSDAELDALNEAVEEDVSAVAVAKKKEEAPAEEESAK